MWLRRQDELNESRPTERFSTAIRLLAGRSALERRAARALGDQTSEQQPPAEPSADAADPGVPSASAPTADPADVPTERAAWHGDSSVDAAPATAVAEPGTRAGGDGTSADHRADDHRADEHRAADRQPGDRPSTDRHATDRHGADRHGADRHATDRHATDRHGADRHATDRHATDRHSAERRARLLARRRRMVTLLFLAFALGAVLAAVAGFAFLWVPAVPGALLTLYIGHLRRLERQRYEVKLDRVRAAQAAERLRERERARAAAVPVTEPATERRPSVAPEPATTATALAEATEHEEWVDGVRARAAAGPDSWEPVPVPLPTYVTAPVAPRVTRGLDLSAPGTWDSGRPGTPLFDQYADPAAQAGAEYTRPRAANE
ncbi:gephyrin-like molybdotransferase receptor GlpR [Kitasatospora sp. NPDC049285]|uniref:divisome protein SepX/GlpR n=1 Tax=Kitasatospora sp. NPDC049285 TaxID=3157096 RepID=UPI00342F1A8D